jgi:hypothetical protein
MLLIYLAFKTRSKAYSLYAGKEVRSRKKRGLYILSIADIIPSGG